MMLSRNVWIAPPLLKPWWARLLQFRRLPVKELRYPGEGDVAHLWLQEVEVEEEGEGHLLANVAPPPGIAPPPSVAPPPREDTPDMHTDTGLSWVRPRPSRVGTSVSWGWGTVTLYTCVLNGVLNEKAVVAAFNQDKALVGAFSVITNLRMDLRFKLYWTLHPQSSNVDLTMVYFSDI